MSAFDDSRRRFLRTLGLGLGARVLAPLAATLHGQAWGQTLTKKKVVFIGLGAGLPDLQLGLGTRTSDTQWDYHEALAALAPWKQKTAILTGLNLRIPGMQHSGGYGVLSCLPTLGGADAEGGPGGATIDQLLGQALGDGTTFNTLLFGIDQDESKVVHQSLFAAGMNQPVPYPARASALFERLFPNAANNPAAAAGDRRVLARLGADVRRVRQRLAGEERAKLDAYLASIEAFERRRSGQSCLAPGAPSSERGAVAELPAMLDMAALALRCGLTNVVGCAVGGGNSHSHFPRLKGLHLGTRFEAQGFVGNHGHDSADAYRDARTIAWRWLSGLVADFLRKLEVPLPDGRRLIDETVVVLFSDSGPDHHNGNSWRFVVIGDAGGALRTQGRFLVFPEDVYWEPVKPLNRTVNSLYTALCSALGLPLGSLGEFTPGRSSAPLPELLT